MTKTHRKHYDELALTKNHSGKVGYRKRQAEEQEAQEEIEQAVKDLSQPTSKEDDSDS